MTSTGARRLGVIGYPIRHSVSPAFQQAALDALGIPARYERFEVAPAGLPSLLMEVRAEEWLGMNVTIPHKQAVIPLLDSVEPLALATGSVNTVVRSEDGRLRGYSTDAAGFLAALEGAGFGVEGALAVVLGTGGTARAVVAGLIERGATAVTILGRSTERAGAVLEQMRRLPLDGARTRLDAARWTPDDPAWDPLDLADLLRRADLLVNTTPIGMRGGPEEGESPLPAFLLHADLRVFDAVYNPVETPLLVAARAAGAPVVSGLDMLVYQGAASFTLWTGRDAPIEVMKTAVRAALEGET